MNDTNNKIKLGLERMTSLCSRLGDPQNKIKTIHVAGTNGKGSFSAVLAQILKEAGYKTGSFSSPGITDIADCFHIDCKIISYEELSDTFDILAPYSDIDTDDPPTEFECLTAAAFIAFERNNCDIAIVECGLGGDGDATNVIDSPVLSVITDIDLDHMAYLGNTIKEITSHKAGIIKPGRPVLYSGNNKDALEVISERAAELNSPLYITDKSCLRAVSHSLKGTVLRHDVMGELKTPLLGTYQTDNIANVLTAVDILRKEGLDIPENAVIAGLKNVRWHGRFEVLSESPLIIFDGAHNPAGITRAAESIETYFDDKITLLIGVMADKDYKVYPGILGKYTDKAIVVSAPSSRGLNCQYLAEEFEKCGINTEAYDSMYYSIRRALQNSEEKNIPLVILGSLYLYSKVTNMLKYSFKFDLPEGVIIPKDTEKLMEHYSKRKSSK